MPAWNTNRNIIVRLTSLGASVALCLVLAITCATAVALPMPSDFKWIEAEDYDAIAPASQKVTVGDWGQPKYLSGGKWLQIKIDADQVEKQTPTEGIVLTYHFGLDKSSVYTVWNRVGFEGIRSPFEWSVDSRPWHEARTTDNTVDVEELSTWSPVAWLPMGVENLDAGQHTLQIRIKAPHDDKGKPAQLMYTSDAIVFAAAPFHPNGPLKPWLTDWQTDADRAAKTKAFAASAVADTAAQRSISLVGDWETTADDEMTVQDRLGPLDALPDLSQFAWKAIAIPGDRNTVLPEMSYVHRYYLRTHLQVASDLKGHSLVLHFPAISMIGTAFVNGTRVGFTKTPYAAWDIDITSAVHFGESNEIVIAIKDIFYAMSDPIPALHPQYLPFTFWHYNQWMHCDMPVLSHYDSGILHTPTLIVAGTAYTSDVFPIASVKNKSLTLEITLHNPTSQAITANVANEVAPHSGGPVELKFPSQMVSLPPGQDTVVKINAPWSNPKLWWPDDPQQYDVTTSVIIDGKPVDVRKTKFGFREWEWQGTNFSLNGVPFHGRADLYDYDRADEESVAAWKKHGQTFQRMWGEHLFSGLEPEAALDFYDSHGVPIRRTDIFDGEGADGFYDVTNKALWNNYRLQLGAWIRSQRNHPSIFIWSLENEITFINAHVFGLDEVSTREHHKSAEVAAAADPSRPFMVDGGNALLDESLPVYGGHYMEPAVNTLPEGAYDKAGFAHREVWPITKDKPILLGEAFFANGWELSDLATIGGEQTFIGKTEARPAIGEIARMLSEGYRWNDINFHFWFGGETEDHYIAWQPIAAIFRQYNWTFASSSNVNRTIGVFNDTRFDDPIALKWNLELPGHAPVQGSLILAIAPGTKKICTLTLSIPAVTSRAEGKLSVQLLRKGKIEFSDHRDISVLPSPSITAINRVQTSASHDSGSASVVTSGLATHSYNIAVFDPTGAVPGFLNRLHVPFEHLQSLATLPNTSKVLIIGRDALDAVSSGSSHLAAWTEAGRVLIVLEQKNPLRYQGLPGVMETADNRGDVAFLEDPDNPLVRGLKQKDFEGWGADSAVYTNAYLKPTSGGKSIVQCDNRLSYTALTQMPAGKGIILLCQLNVGQNLAEEIVPQHLLLNMLAFGSSYHLTNREVTVSAGDNTQLVTALKATGLQYSVSADPLSAIRKARSVAIIDGSPSNVRSLAENAAAVKAFTAGGGWIILNRIGPESLQSYNKLVGWDHIMRPFTQEKVTWPTIRAPLTAGLSATNIVMGSGKQIFNFAAGQYPDTNAYSYVVDLDEVAPFAKSPFFAYDKITNNYTQNDGFWPLIINFPPNKDGSPYQIPIHLARPEKIVQFTWVGNQNYDATTKISLALNGDLVGAPKWDIAANDDPQTFPVTSTSPASDVTLQVLAWQTKPNTQDNLGIDNIYLNVYRSQDFYKRVKPMLNIGAMVEYPMGAGGIVLCNVKFRDTEENPENTAKKQTIIATILRNLEAPFAGKSLIAGGALAYKPIDISKQANQFRGEQGWFGDKQTTFADLPSGSQTFAGVTYDIYNFRTSPVPTAVMLGGNGVPGNLPDAVRGLAIHQKADALFFLQTARIDQSRDDREKREKREYEIARYVVHYADGQSLSIPLREDFELADYRQMAPSPLPNAQLAWTKPYASGGFKAAAYSMQWNNPRPEVAIESVDLEYGKDRRGVPVLLAVTAATAK